MTAKVLTAAAAIAFSIAIPADGNAPSNVITKPLQAVLNVTTTELPKTQSAEVQVRSGTLAPGSSTFWHSHPSPPFIFIESGTGTWEYRGDRPPDTRRAGQAIMEPANVVLRLVNRGATPLRIVIFQVSKPGDPVLRPAP